MLRPPRTVPLGPLPFAGPPRALQRWTLVAATALCLAANAADAPPPQTAEARWESVLPVLEQKCFECHGGKSTKGGVDLRRLRNHPAVLQEYELWTKVRDAIRNAEMPPEEAKPLAETERLPLLQWVNAALDEAARAHAGDPGLVTLRRLTNAEYDYTLRDLTGLNLALAKDFVPDGGGGEGFSNLGDVLFVSPQQLDKYLSAARKLTEHATILPGSGIQFSLQRVGTRGPLQFRADTESQMYVWYQKAAEPWLPKDGGDLREADYLLACWKWKHRDLTGATSLQDLAKEADLFLPFLENWWGFLQRTDPPSRFLDLTRLPWLALPGPQPETPKSIPPEVQSAITAIAHQRQSWLLPKAWPVQRAQQDADELRNVPLQCQLHENANVHLVAGDLGDGNRGDIVRVSGLEITRQGKKQPYRAWLEQRRDADRKSLEALPPGSEPSDAQKDLESRIAEAERLLALFGKHPQSLEVAPDALVLQAPQILTLPVPPDAKHFKASGNLEIRGPDAEFATVQWMATAATPPDPARIIPGVLTVWKRQSKAHRDAMADFDRMKAVFPHSQEDRLGQVAANRFRREQAGPGVYYLSDTQLAKLLPPAEWNLIHKTKEDWRFVSEKSLPQNLENEWDKRVLGHLWEFAARAWRRPISAEENEPLAEVYRAGLSQGLDRESAAREVLVRILVAPAFLFKLEAGSSPGIHPVSPWELATRLSYFLWSSIPDDTLRQKAADGSLANPDVLRQETLRMIRDPKAVALAREFAAQWFEFRDFDTYTKVDTGRFPEFSPELRRDFHEEAVAFLEHIFRESRPISEILSADYSFLNNRLASHYGIPDVSGESFRKVHVGAYSRGGLLGMGALLTKTSYPHRTSPVLRGNWLLHNVLGTPTPAPPNDVPKLDESVAAAKTLRERLERHRADRACSGCHDKMDPLGFALEAFDPIGRLRKSDEAGLGIDDSSRTKDGHAFTGLSGLRDYLKTRQGEFHALFSRKLLGYALGRAVLPTDKLLLEEMQNRLQQDNPTFAEAALWIVQSPQFLRRRGE